MAELKQEVRRRTGPADIVYADNGCAKEGRVDIRGKRRTSQNQWAPVALDLLNIGLGEGLGQVYDARGIEAKVLQRLAKIRPRRLAKGANVHVPPARRRGVEGACEEAAIKLGKENVFIQRYHHGQCGVEALAHYSSAGVWREPETVSEVQYLLPPGRADKMRRLLP